MIYKSLNENIQIITEKKINNNIKNYFKIVLNELKYKHYYNMCYLSNNKCSIFINNYNIDWFSLIDEDSTDISYYIYITYNNVKKQLHTYNELLFKKKKLLIIQQIYKWNIKKYLLYKNN